MEQLSATSSMYKLYARDEQDTDSLIYTNWIFTVTTFHVMFVFLCELARRYCMYESIIKLFSDRNKSHHGNCLTCFTSTKSNRRFVSNSVKKQEKKGYLLERAIVLKRKR